MRPTWFDLGTLVPMLLIAWWLLRVAYRCRRAGRPLRSERAITIVIVAALANHVMWILLRRTVPWVPWISTAALIVGSYTYLAVQWRRYRHTLHGGVAPGRRLGP